MQDTVDLEGAMARSADRLRRALGHGFDRHHVDRATGKQDRIVCSTTAGHSSTEIEGGAEVFGAKRIKGDLSVERFPAIEHIADTEGVMVVVCFPGASESTKLAAASEGCEHNGHLVRAAA